MRLSYLLSLRVLGAVFAASITTSKVLVWEDSDWRLERNEDVVPAVNESHYQDHYHYTGAIGQKSGNFWQFYRRSSDLTFYGQRFKIRDNSMIGGQINLNQNDGDNQVFIEVAHLDTTDGFVYGWYSDDVDSDGSAAVMRIFDAEGNPVTDDIIVNSQETSYQYLRGISTIESTDTIDERIVAVYSDARYGYDSFARLFEVDGTPISEVQLDPSHPSWVFQPRVAGLSDGKFVAMWLARDNSDYSRRAQVFNHDLSEYSSAKTLFPDMDYQAGRDYRMTSLVGDIFIIVGRNESGDHYESTGSIYDAYLNQCGTEFVINNYTETNQQYPHAFRVEIMSDSIVVFTVTWMSSGREGSTTNSVYAQLFALDMPMNGNCSESDQAYKIGKEFSVWAQQPSQSSYGGRGIAIDDNGQLVIPIQGYSLLSNNYWGAGVQIFQLINPEFTVNPTMQTVMPTRNPSSNPTTNPTSNPTRSPTADTIQPTMHPTGEPSHHPSRNPSYSPTRIPTKFPSLVPSKIPSKPPTQTPTQQPTNAPVVQPTAQPITAPSPIPSVSPTNQPSFQPTEQPSESPIHFIARSQRQTNNSLSGLENPLVLAVLGISLILCCMCWCFVVLGCFIYNSQDRGHKRRMHSMMAAMQVANEQNRRTTFQSQGYGPRSEEGERPEEYQVTDVELPPAPVVNSDNLTKMNPDDGNVQLPPLMEFQLTKSDSCQSIHDQAMDVAPSQPGGSRNSWSHF